MRVSVPLRGKDRERPYGLETITVCGFQGAFARTSLTFRYVPFMRFRRATENVSSSALLKGTGFLTNCQLFLDLRKPKILSSCQFLAFSDERDSLYKTLHCFLGCWEYRTLKGNTPF